MKRVIFILFAILMPMLAIGSVINYFTIIWDDYVYYGLDYENNLAEVVKDQNRYKGDIVIKDLVEYKGQSFSVVAICRDAFYNCVDLTSVTIPHTMQDIDRYSFGNCSNLKDVYCYAQNPPSTKKDTFDGVNLKDVILHVPSSALIMYRSFSPWSSFGSVVGLDDGGNSDIEDIDMTTLLGTWKCIMSIDIVEGEELIDYMKGQYLTANADGTYTSTSNEIGKGKYLVQGNSFVAQNESGSTFTATISISENQMRMEGTSSYGVSFTYYFVKVEEIDVLGTWKCISSSDVVDGKEITNYMKGQYLTANADGTYTSTSEEMGYGTYTLMGNTFTARNNLGATFTATVFVSGDQLTMEGYSSFGVSFKYIFERSNGEPEPDNPSGDPTKRSIHVANAGTLSDYISEEERNQIEELTLTGEINGTDLLLLRTMAGCPKSHSDFIGKGGDDGQGCLVSLDLSDVKIVAGGDRFYYFVLDYYGIDKDRLFYIEEDNIIPAAAFVESKVREIILPTNITSIGEYAFYGSANLKSIAIPSSVTSIGDNAFNSCNNLTSITLPNSVTSIGEYAFRGCVLQKVNSKIENPFDIDTTTFSDNTFYNATLYVPAGTIDKYKTADGWKYFYNIIELDPSGINNVKFDGIEKTSVYDLCGRRLNQSQKGINIIRQSDGTIKKVVVR